LSNPQLSALFTEKIGDNWLKDLKELRKLEQYLDDPEFRQRWYEIKQANKADLAAYMLKTRNIEVDVNSIFDVQVKRIHEYKRQHLAVLHIIALYNRIKQNPQIDIVPAHFYLWW
jgi:starch phosphorylase